MLDVSEMYNNILAMKEDIQSYLLAGGSEAQPASSSVSLCSDLSAKLLWLGGINNCTCSYADPRSISPEILSTGLNSSATDLDSTIPPMSAYARLGESWVHMDLAS